LRVEKRVLDVDSTLTGEKVVMTIDEGALVHIMSVLTDLYSDPVLAVIREYSTNAFDAHVEAGQTRPIEITTPTSLSPFFRVKDFGNGLDADDIRDIYSRYGTSTKRESNDVVGMLGLGCKSALTYTDQFTLTGIKNGKATQVSVSRDEDNGSSMTIVAEYETDESSGVEVIVPTKINTYSDFERKCMEFFSFWTEGTVLINNAKPARVGWDDNSGLWLSDKMFISPNLRRSYIVMGNVPYPVPADLGSLRGSNGHHWHQFVAFVDIGEVQFTPSREALQMTKKTKENIEQLREKIAAERDKVFIKMIKEAPDRFGAVVIFHKALKMGLGVTEVRYKGEIVPINIAHPTRIEKDSYGHDMKVRDPLLLLSSRASNGYYYSRGDGCDKIDTIASINANSYLWFTGYTSKNVTPYRRKKLYQWIEKNNIDVSMLKGIILVDSLPMPKWIDKKMVRAWAGPDTEKIERTNPNGLRSDGRPSGSYDGYVKGKSKRGIPAAEIDTTNEIFWVHSRDADWHLQKYFSETLSKSTLIFLEKNRIVKFERDFPTAKNASQYIKDTAKAWKDSLTDDDIMLLHMSYNDSYTLRLLKGFDYTKIDDPELARMIKVANSGMSDSLMIASSLFNRYVKTPSPKKYVSPFKAYPLLTTTRYYDSLDQESEKHLYIYLNAVYRDKVESKAKTRRNVAKSVQPQVIPVRSQKFTPTVAGAYTLIQPSPYPYDAYYIKNMITS
jgi:hypothetical protein